MTAPRTTAPYRLNARVFSRDPNRPGENALRRTAYRSGERLQDHRDGQVFDFSRRDGVLHTEIIAPAHAAAWVYDRETLWNRVEAKEDTSTRRSKAQLAREVQLMLPRELSLAQCVAVVRSFVQDQFVRVGMVADIAIHDSEASDGERQPHAHVMLTMRALEPDGFGRKVREWNDVKFYLKQGDPNGSAFANADQEALVRVWRAGWATALNDALEDAEAEARVDHRRLELQDTPREAEPHLGIVHWISQRLVPALSHNLQQRVERWSMWDIKRQLREQIGAIAQHDPRGMGTLISRWFYQAGRRVAGALHQTPSQELGHER